MTNKSDEKHRTYFVRIVKIGLKKPTYYLGVHFVPHVIDHHWRIIGKIEVETGITLTQ